MFHIVPACRPIRNPVGANVEERAWLRVFVRTGGG